MVWADFAAYSIFDVATIISGDDEREESQCHLHKKTHVAAFFDAGA